MGVRVACACAYTECVACVAAEYLIHNLYHKWCVITDRACRGLCVLHV